METVLSHKPKSRALNSLRNWIEDGVLPPGQPLPTEQELATRLQVSRGTLRTALARLDEEGLTYSNGGRLRLVAGETKRAPQGRWMAEATIVLSSDPDHRRHQEHGWREFMTLTALQKLREHGHTLLLNPEQLDGRKLEEIVASGPAGVVVLIIDAAPELRAELLGVLRGGRVPTVVYGDAPESRDFDCVTTDHEAGAAQIARWLWEQGRQRIAFIGDEGDSKPWLGKRRMGYERALREAGLEPRPIIAPPPFPRVVPPEEDRAGMFARTARLWAGYLAEHLTRPDAPDALMAPSDGECFAIAAACRLLGKAPNDDVWIAGYDNYWAGSPERAFESFVPVATVDKGNDLIGAQAVDLLRERIAGSLPPPAQRRVVAPQLILPLRCA